MKNKTLYILLAAFVLASMVLTACGPSTTPEPAPAPAETEAPAPAPAETEAPAPEAAAPLVIGTTDSWSSFEVAWVYSFHDWELFHQCADGLLNNVPGTAGEVTPALAESYDVSEDGKTYTFHLREGVVFPNGDPLNADVVVWSLQRVYTIQDIEGDNANFLVTAYVESKDAIKKVDDMTVEVTFAEPFAFAPQLIATNPWKIVNPNQWTDTEANTTNTACGIGPYTITNFTEGEEAIFEANPTYYGDAPKTEKVIVRYFADSPTMALALKNGEIDVAWKQLAPADMDALQDEAGITVEKSGGTEIRYIVWNSTTPPYDNPKVRLGLSMLLNREELADLGWQGIKVPLYSMVPPGFLGHKPTFEGTEDVEGGKALLAEAGFDENNPLVLDLWYSPTHYGDTEADVAAVIKQQWEASGVVQVNLQFLEWAAYRDAGRAGEMPVSLLGWYPDYLDPDNYTNVFAHSPAAWSGSFYNNPDMDALLDAQAAERDEATRIALLEQVQDLWATDVPFTPLVQGGLYVAYRDGISNVVLDPLGLFHYFLIEKK
ncbi:MAG: peptide ABC transporter substrate-binding protein [Chloroflexi bacterium]|nr:peptide ABC transporter substrate-binding protein [Chloroflexota bacterium]